MNYDLHTHSHMSDGILSPEDLVSSAKLAGVTCLALTDHDTVSGIASAKVAAQALDMRLISGIEVSCTWRGRGIHILGLDIDETNSVLLEFIRAQRQARDARAVTISERLEKVGISGALAAAQKLAGGGTEGKGTVGRPHFAQFLVDQGHVSSMNAAFKQYLGNGKLGDVKSVWPTIARAVEVISAAGGLAVVAHPLKYKLTRTKVCELLSDFTEWGGHGVEVISGKQTDQETRDLSRMATRFKLLSSCGSDFHAPGQPWQALGSCGDLPEKGKPIWGGFD